MSKALKARLAQKRKALYWRASPAKRRSIGAIKRAALRASQSAQDPSGSRLGFGFVPADAEVKVLSWPKL